MDLCISFRNAPPGKIGMDIFIPSKAYPVATPLTRMCEQIPRRWILCKVTTAVEDHIKHTAVTNIKTDFNVTWNPVVVHTTIAAHGTIRSIRWDLAPWFVNTCHVFDGDSFVASVTASFTLRSPKRVCCHGCIICRGSGWVLPIQE